MTRRNVLQLGLSTAALLAMPPLGRIAKADPTNPHFLVMFFSDGGWDPTQTLDPHDPLDMTDGVDVDVPEAISGLPPRRSRRSAASPTCRTRSPARTSTRSSTTGPSGRAIVNGINTRSTSHDQSRQLVLTGYLDPTQGRLRRHGRAPQRRRHAAAAPPAERATSFGGPFAGLSGRVGGQMRHRARLQPHPGRTDRRRPARRCRRSARPTSSRRSSEQQRARRSPSSAVSRQARGVRRRQRARRPAGRGSPRSLRINTNDGAHARHVARQRVPAPASRRASQSNPAGGFDTHGDNTRPEPALGRALHVPERARERPLGAARPGGADPARRDDDRRLLGVRPHAAS